MTEYQHRHWRARNAYFAEHPGTREAHDAREAAQTVVYQLKYGRRPSQRDVDLAQGFRWGNRLREGVDVAGLLTDGQNVE